MIRLVRIWKKHSNNVYRTDLFAIENNYTINISKT